ncbi:MAG TPA: hypothetical protein VGI67_18875, partial [Thermoleophilaceae bacterium]
EERDPGNARSSAEPDVVPRYAHLTTPYRCRLPIAARRRRLGDHVIAARLKNNVEVGVAFGTNEHHRGSDGENVMLERQSCRGQVRRRRPGNEEVDLRLTGWQQTGPVLKRLHSPPIADTG